MAEKTVYIIDLNDKVTGKLKNVQNEAKKTDGAFSGLSNMLGSLGIGVGIGTLTALAKGIYDITAGAEQTRIKFETMLGSVDKANTLIKDIRGFAAATPFETGDLEKAATTMLQFGIDAEKIMPNIRMLGDVAGGNAEKFDRLTYAFSQINAAGRLMGQDLLQLINAGFNPLQTISEKTGLSLARLKADMEDGKITADMVAEAFRIETAEGGRFFGMMEKQSKTLSGRMGTLLDEIKMIGLAMGETASGGMSMFIDASQRAASTVRETTWQDFFTSIWEGNDGLRMMWETLKQIGDVLGIVNVGTSGFQMLIDGLTVTLRMALLPIKAVFDSMVLLYEVIKSLAVAGAKLFSGDFEGASKSFGGIEGKFNKLKKDFTGIFDFEGRGFGQSLQSIEEGKKPRSFGLDAALAQQSGFYDKYVPGGVFDSLKQSEEKKKTKRQGVGGISLNESRNGSTHITFNIDTFQKNEFTKDGSGVSNASIKNFLDQMALGLQTVLNDSQIVARQ
jgi:tape measure domain-containing protein